MQADTQTLYIRLTWSDVVTGEGRELIAPLPVSFGRANENTVVLNSNKASRNHAVLKARDGGVILEDLHSTNLHSKLPFRPHHLPKHPTGAQLSLRAS